MITCLTCNIAQPELNFYGHPKKTGKCKKCVSIYSRLRKDTRYTNHKRWVSENRDRNRRLCREAAEKTRPQRDAVIDAAKDRPCTDCGLRFPPLAMDFDHLPGNTKRNKVSHLRRLGYSLKYIKEEISKCEVVCSCCHRTRTRKRRIENNTKTPGLDQSRVRKLQLWVEGLKTSPCPICLSQFETWQMDFDHLDPSFKVKSVSELLVRRASKEKILKEIAKCRIICVNCHRCRLNS